MATQVLPPYLTATTATVTVNGVVQTQIETVLVTSALPVQQLPPFLSASTFTTVIGGVEVTAVSTVGVPLTYIGPSIPLGPDDVWTFLGSTTPASITQTSSTATPSTSSSQNTQPSSTQSPSESLSTTNTISSTSTPTTVATSPAATSSGAGSNSATKKGLSAGQLAGIIIAAVVTAIVIAMLLTLWCCRRRRRRNPRFQPDLSDFVFIESDGEARVPGEGSPRPDGGEEDSFLRGTRETPGEMREIAPLAATARLVSGDPSPTETERTTGTIGVPEGVVPLAYKTPPSSPPRPSGPKLPSPFFHASASSLFFNPSRGPDRSLAGRSNGNGTATKRDSGSTQTSSSGSPASRHVIGNIIPTRQLMQMDEQWKGESTGSKLGVVGSRKGTTEMGERSALVASPLRPPRTMNNETNPSRQESFLTSLRTTGTHPDSAETDDERATLLTAHRFNLSPGGPGVLIPADTSHSSNASPSSWQSSLEALGRLSRFSWFQRLNARASHRHSTGPMTTSSASTHPLPSVTTHSSVVVPPTRPVSDLTSSSTGNTTFYDAPSGPSTMSTRSGKGRRAPPRPVSMPPLPPRAVTAITGTGNSSAPQSPGPRLDNGSDGSSSFNQPALLYLDPATAPGSPMARLDTPPPLPEPPRIPPVPPMDEPIDILDTPVPAPAAVSPFSTASTRGGPAIPPGLDLANIRAWRESSSDMPSSATFGSRSDHGRVSVDIVGDDTLEDAPPLPRANWAQLRSVTIASTAESNRTRRTLGQPLNEEENIQSDAGSLHSIPEYLGPLSPVGSFGPHSRSPSRANNSSVNSHSGSSRFSQGPPSRNGNGLATAGTSASSQLEHSNSISSEGRRRPRREAGEPLLDSLSPTSLSPANSLHFRRARMSAVGGNQQPSRSQSRAPSGHQSPSDTTFVHGNGASIVIGRIS